MPRQFQTELWIGVRECAWSLRGDGVSWELEGDAEEAEKEEGLGNLQREIVDYLREHGPAGPRELVRELGSSTGAISKALGGLDHRGVARSSAGKWSV